MKIINLYISTALAFCFQFNLNAGNTDSIHENNRGIEKQAKKIQGTIEGKIRPDQFMETGTAIMGKYYPGMMFVPGPVVYENGRLIMKARVADKEGNVLDPFYMDVTNCAFVIEGFGVDNPMPILGIKTRQDAETSVSDIVKQFFPDYKLAKKLLVYSWDRFVLKITLSREGDEKMIYFDVTDYIDEYKRLNKEEPEEALHAKAFSKGKFFGNPINLSDIINERELDEQINSCINDMYPGYRAVSIGDMGSMNGRVRMCILKSEEGDKKEIYFDITDYMTEAMRKKSPREKRKLEREKKRNQ